MCRWSSSSIPVASQDQEASGSRTPISFATVMSWCHRMRQPVVLRTEKGRRRQKLHEHRRREAPMQMHGPRARSDCCCLSDLHNADKTGARVHVLVVLLSFVLSVSFCIVVVFLLSFALFLLCFVASFMVALLLSCTLHSFIIPVILLTAVHPRILLRSCAKMKAVVKKFSWVVLDSLSVFVCWLCIFA